MRRANAQTTDELVTTIAIPRSALTIVSAPPDTISQKTAETVTGLPRRIYLESLTAYRAAGGVVASVGKLRVVERAPFVRWLLSHTQAATVASVEPADGADELAAELGFAIQKGGAK